MIDPRAAVDPAAELASDVEVGAFSVIGPKVRIGAGTWIGPHVVIEGPARIGRDNRIFQFASVGDIPQDKKYEGETTELVIGDRNTIREYCTINRGTRNGQGATIIGNDNWIMAYVHIAHDCVVGDHTVFSNGATLAGHVTVEDYATLGGFTLVHQFCRIGCHAFSGMGTALNRDLPPYVLASGNLASPHGINKVGLRRHGFSADTIQALHKAYMLLIKSRNRRDDDPRQLEQLINDFPEVARLAEFVSNSPRGVVR
ncbi:MAG: acyl-ACP--UDP-N-acetylglucosamine O-acyltransferase [Gammaproteobacteria bacterium]